MLCPVYDHGNVMTITVGFGTGAEISVPVCYRIQISPESRSKERRQRRPVLNPGLVI